MTPFHLTASHPSENGESSPPGSTLCHGVQIFLYSAKMVLLLSCCYSIVLMILSRQEWSLDPGRNKTYHYWHTFQPNISSGQLYAYRIHGPFEPWNGHRYDATKILLDPYANIVAVPENYHRSGADFSRTNRTPPMKSAVTDLSLYDWEGDGHLKNLLQRQLFMKCMLADLHARQTR